jgi:hypothetical protein
MNLSPLSLLGSREFEICSEEDGEEDDSDRRFDVKSLKHLCMVVNEERGRAGLCHDGNNKTFSPTKKRLFSSLSLSLGRPSTF